MKRLTLDASWPESWKLAHQYDLQEVWGEVSHRGYAYAYANRRRRTLTLLEEVLPTGSTVLDVAAAQGNFSLTLAEAGYVVTWNDLRAELADYVRLKHERGTLEYAPGNVFDLTFAEPFDCVLITEIIEHVAHPDEFLRKVADLVKPGGYVVMSTPNGGYFRHGLPRFSECPDPEQYEDLQFKPNADGHIFLLWPDEVAWLATEAKLTLEKHVLFTNPLTAGHMKLEAVLRCLPRRIPEGLEALSQALGTGIKTRLMANAASRFKKPEAIQESCTPRRLNPT